MWAREHQAGPRQKGFEHRPFARRQHHRLAIHRDFACGRVDAHALVFVHRLGAPGSAAQQGADAREQFVHVVGLEHVVVGPGIQPLDALLHRIAGGGDQHRQAVLARAQRPQHRQTIAPGQAQVEQQQVVVLRAQRRVGQLAVLHPVHRVVFGAQQIEHGLADHGVVFYQQQSHGGFLRRPGPQGPHGHSASAPRAKLRRN
ncbi:hypothetical protein D9M69_581210 [compost metagenome]